MKKKIIRSILRSTRAYELYKKDRMYYQALRIFNANKKIYKLLIKFSYSCDEDFLIYTHDYIFHLEDWFLQFDKYQNKNPDLESIFTFERLKGSIAFPINFINLIKKT